MVRQFARHALGRACGLAPSVCERQLTAMVDAPGGLQSSLAGRYRIEREIGAGGMATVYLARDVRHGRAVALKVLRSDVAAAMGVTRFQHEVTLTAALQHPHILSLFDSGESAGCLYYVAPYVDGESLREKLGREGQLRIDETLEITRQVADALDYAHRSGIVHRDIKPGNVLLAAYAGDRRVHALVADFGIARALPRAGDSSVGLATADAHRLTEAGITLGTPMYMSPEQAMGDSRVDGRSDIYSLGCMVYEMLAGEPPFTEASIQSLAARKLSASISSIATIRSSVPSSVDAIIRRALLPVAADRYATAGEFAAALTAAFATARDSQSSQRGQVAGAPTAGVSRRFSRPGVAALVTAGLALIGVAAWAWSTRTPHAMARVRASAPRDSQAYALDRQARFEIDRRTEASVARAVGLLQRAIARDSDYVDAWADLTRALVFAHNNRYDVPGIPRAQLVAYGIRAGDRALEADSMSAIAWIARATSLYLIDPSTEHGVIPALHRATALDSNSADAWYLLGDYYEDALEPDSALRAFRRATTIRPTHPGALAFLALHFMWQRQSDSAMVWADSAARSNPTNVLSRQVRGLVLMQRGQVADAAEEFAATVGVGQGPERVWGWTGLAVVAWRRHDRRATDSLIVRAIADADTLHPSHHEAVYLAWMYAETGQRKRALDVLERFAEPRHLHFQLHLRREFTLDSLRHEARFAALLRNDSTPRLQ
jgi:tetratricopeptide (TPR) repeat protein